MTGTTGPTTTEEAPPSEEEPIKGRNQSTVAIIGALGGFVVLASGGAYYMWKSLPSVFGEDAGSDLVADSDQMTSGQREQFLDDILSF